MGILIGLERVDMEWPNKRVLEGQTIGIDEGDRIGIVGRNGDGKSTLLELIAREVEPDAGAVTWRNGISVGVLGQSDALTDDETVEHAVVGEQPEYVWASDPRVRGVIDELLGDIDWHARVGELSGGQRRRCDLARVLVGRWDVLLMDEPTNHLDMQAIGWLADHLKGRWPQGQGALLLVTHDRWFLDEVCDHMWEVHDGAIDPFEGGYSAYVQQRFERQRQAAVMEERRQNVLRKELNWLAHGAKARSSKPKFRIDAAMELLAGDPPLRDTVELRRMAVSRLGKQVIEMRGASFSYPGSDAPVVSGVDWIVGPGDRFGILGENGAGKSTLLSLMTGRLRPSSGSVRIGASVRFGILSQNLGRLSERDGWRVQELLSSYKSYYVVDGRQQSPERLLERLGFDRREFASFVGELSGGQRRRLAIMCVLMEEPNVLVLDEPGNDLDTDMLAVLEDLLDGWPGTLLLVSHDRYLMERVTDDQFALLDGRVRHVPGGVDEYLRLLGEHEPANDGARARVATAPPPAPAEEGGEARLSNAERRELKKRYDAVGRRLERLEGEPERLEAEMAQVDASNYEALMAAQASVDAARAEQASLEDEWLELGERLGIE
ncbi:ABC-F family ATP-binding cassette domain-containing protein [Olsenella sp. DNF00959]|uniref:ABC-F family ATP-binding cassette domain-containing protein n=1 Tax=Olsenella sp. DNF00959 TaxID=1476999 RepID=UPI000781D5FC|nr:ABC-F family ATP-binding cassette domain-containing protein [Olsenella sp. DNF00959]KXB63466.1 ABC transporter, ATP-binding protein [Olsenella sp. DNF00959]